MRTATRAEELEARVVQAEYEAELHRARADKLQRVIDRVWLSSALGNKIPAYFEACVSPKAKESIRCKRTT